MNTIAELRDRASWCERHIGHAYHYTIGDMKVDRDAAAEIERLTAENERRKAALEACVEFWSDTDIPCPIALHDKVTDAIGAFQQSTVKDKA